MFVFGVTTQIHMGLAQADYYYVPLLFYTFITSIPTLICEWFFLFITRFQILQDSKSYLCITFPWPTQTKLLYLQHVLLLLVVFLGTSDLGLYCLSHTFLCLLQVRVLPPGTGFSIHQKYGFKKKKKHCKATICQEKLILKKVCFRIRLNEFDLICLIWAVT